MNKWIKKQNGSIINTNYVETFNLELDYPASRIYAYTENEEIVLGVFRDQDYAKILYLKLEIFLNSAENNLLVIPKREKNE